MLAGIGQLQAGRWDIPSRADCGVCHESAAVPVLGLGALQLSPDRDPLAPRRPHFEGPAKNIIFLFMSGGPSHLETFDPKPELARLHGGTLEVDVNYREGARFVLTLPRARP